jgi:DNA repair exonuclease SbcCD ATPase subunit
MDMPNPQQAPETPDNQPVDFPDIYRRNDSVALSSPNPISVVGVKRMKTNTGSIATAIDTVPSISDATPQAWEWRADSKTVMKKFAEFRRLEAKYCKDLEHDMAAFALQANRNQWVMFKQLEDQKNHFQSMRRRAEDCEGKLVVASTQLSKNQELLDEKETSVKQLKDRIFKLLDTVSVESETNVRLKTQLGASRAMVDAKEDDIKKLQDELDNAKQELQTIRANLKPKDDNPKQRCRIISTSAEGRVDSTTDVETLQNMVKWHLKQLKQAKSYHSRSYKQSKEVIEQHKTQLEASRAMVDYKNAHIRKLQDEIDNVNQELQSIRANLKPKDDNPQQQQPIRGRVMQTAIERRVDSITDVEELRNIVKKQAEGLKKNNLYFMIPREKYNIDLNAKNDDIKKLQDELNNVKQELQSSRANLEPNKDEQYKSDLDARDAKIKQLEDQVKKLVDTASANDRRYNELEKVYNATAVIVNSRYMTKTDQVESGPSSGITNFAGMRVTPGSLPSEPIDDRMQFLCTEDGVTCWRNLTDFTNLESFLIDLIRKKTRKYM